MSSTLRVSNLPLNFTSSMLEDMFTMIGNVRNAQILLDADSVSRGLGLVEMSTADEAQDCIRFFNGQVKDDHAIIVRDNTPHVPRPPPFKKAAQAASRKKRPRGAAESKFS